MYRLFLRRLITVAVAVFICMPSSMQAQIATPESVAPQQTTPEEVGEVETPSAETPSATEVVDAPTVTEPADDEPTEDAGRPAPLAVVNDPVAPAQTAVCGSRNDTVVLPTNPMGYRYNAPGWINGTEGTSSKTYIATVTTPGDTFSNGQGTMQFVILDEGPCVIDVAELMPVVTERCGGVPNDYVAAPTTPLAAGWTYSGTTQNNYWIPETNPRPVTIISKSLDYVVRGQDGVVGSRTIVYVTDQLVPCVIGAPVSPTQTPVCGDNNDTFSRFNSTATYTVVDSGWSGNVRTYTVTPKAGYIFPNGEPLVLRFTDSGPCQWTPPAPPTIAATCGDNNDRVTVRGNATFTYSPASYTASNWVDNTYVITLTPTTGYVIPADQRTIVIEDAGPCVIQAPAAPTFEDNNGVNDLLRLAPKPSDAQYYYRVTIVKPDGTKTVQEYKFSVPPSIGVNGGSVVTVEVFPNPGYTFPDGAVSTWTNTYSPNYNLYCRFERVGQYGVGFGDPVYPEDRDAPDGTGQQDPTVRDFCRNISDGPNYDWTIGWYRIDGPNEFVCFGGIRGSSSGMPDDYMIRIAWGGSNNPVSYEYVPANTSFDLKPPAGVKLVSARPVRPDGSLVTPAMDQSASTVCVIMPVAPISPLIAPVCQADNDELILASQPRGVEFVSDSGWENGERTVTYRIWPGYQLKEGGQLSFTFTDDNVPCNAESPVGPTVAAVCGANNDELVLAEQPEHVVLVSDSGWVDGERTIVYGPEEGWGYEGESIFTFIDANDPCSTEPPVAPIVTAVCGANNDEVVFGEQPEHVVLVSDSGWVDGERVIVYGAEEGWVYEGQSEFAFTDVAEACATPSPSPTEPVTPTPTEPVTPTPTEPVTPSPTEPVTPTPTDPVTPSPTEPAATQTPTTPVSGLPSTGDGSDVSASATAILATALIALILLGIGMRLRHR